MSNWRNSWFCRFLLLATRFNSKIMWVYYWLYSWRTVAVILFAPSWISICLKSARRLKTSVERQRKLFLNWSNFFIVCFVVLNLLQEIHHSCLSLVNCQVFHPPWCHRLEWSLMTKKWSWKVLNEWDWDRALQNQKVSWNSSIGKWNQKAPALLFLITNWEFQAFISFQWSLPPRFQTKKLIGLIAFQLM